MSHDKKKDMRRTVLSLYVLGLVTKQRHYKVHELFEVSRRLSHIAQQVTGVFKTKPTKETCSPPNCTAPKTGR